MMSKASWVGRLGMSLFYKQYNFLKIWWQGALLIFALLMILFTMQSIIQKRLNTGISRTIQAMILIVATGGLYLSYHDFRHNFSHKLLGERFHIGVYLFWIGWIIICLYHLFSRKNADVVTASNNKAGAMPQNQ